MANSLQQYGLTRQEQAFIKALARGIPPAIAFAEAGYQGKASEAAGNAHNLARRSHIQAAFHAELAALLAADGAVARAVVLEVVNDPNTPAKTRGDLAIKLLDRAGHVAPRAPAPENRVDRALHELSADELRTMVGQLESELARRAKPVNDTTARTIDLQAIDIT